MFLGFSGFKLVDVWFIDIVKTIVICGIVAIFVIVVYCSNGFVELRSECGQLYCV